MGVSKSKFFWSVIIFLLIVLVTIFNVVKIIVFEERTISKEIYIFIVFLFTTLLLILFKYFSLKSNKRYSVIKIIEKILLFATPCLSYIMFETITGNLLLIRDINIIIINLICFYSLFILIFILSNKSNFTIIFTNSILLIVALTNFFVSEFRGRPFMIGDLSLIKTSLSVTESYEFNLNEHIITGFSIYGLILITSILVEFKFIQKIQRVCFNVVMIFLLSFFSYVVFSGYVINKYNLTVNQWSPLTSYQNNGFMLSSIVSFETTHVQEPNSYSQKKLNKIVSKIQKGEDETIFEQPENLIVIMNESFSDFRTISDFKTNEEVTPIIDNLNENVIKGNLYVSVFGGSTANTEYEFLTGNSVAFLPSSIIAYQNYIKENNNSFVKKLKQNNYDTTAFHPYEASNYNRDVVYPNMGFNTYLSLDDYNGKFLRWWPDDSDTFKQIINIYEEKQNEKMFIFNVTMQNHGPYDDKNFSSDIKLVDYPNIYPETEQYLSLLKESDKAFGELINYFSNIKEKTVIVMFGDHFPNVETGFFEELYGKKISDLTNEETIEMYKTPFVVWSNYEIESDYIDKISVNFFNSYIMKKFGFETTLYQEYLYNLYLKVPVISTIGYYDNENNFYSWDDLSPYKNVINEYEMLQYNNLFDDEHLIEDIFN